MPKHLHTPLHHPLKQGQNMFKTTLVSNETRKNTNNSTFPPHSPKITTKTVYFSGLFTKIWSKCVINHAS